MILVLCVSGEFASCLTWEGCNEERENDLEREKTHRHSTFHVSTLY